MSNKINIVEWFGGIGASSEAFHRIFHKENLNIVDYVEMDKHATKSFNAINGTNFEPRDINDVDVNGYGDVDMLIAGWPCQDLSVAGKGAGIWGNQKRDAIRVFKKFHQTGVMEKLVMEKRSGLIFTTIQNIQLMETKPQHILLENVKGLVSKKWEKDVKLVKLMFDKMGYNWQQVILNSKYFDVPQARQRVFVLLTRKDLPQTDINHLAEQDNVTKVLKDVLDFSEPTFKVAVDQKDGMVYFENEMNQYKGKIIQLNLDKLKAQDPDNINKVATLGTLVDGNLEPVKSFGKRNFVGTKGQLNTITTRPDHDTRVMFKDHTVNQVKNMTGVDGQYQTLTNNNGTGNNIAFEATQNGKPLNTRGQFIGAEGVSRTLSTRPIDGSDAVKVAFDEKGLPFVSDRTFNGTEGIAGTLVANGSQFKNKVIYENLSIIHYRKLSVLECWRLMGFSDRAFNKVKEAGVSPSQMAKQAGNSIVVNVLEAIIREVL